MWLRHAVWAREKQVKEAVQVRCSIPDCIFSSPLLQCAGCRICSQAHRLGHVYIHPTPEEMWSPGGIAEQRNKALAHRRLEVDGNSQVGSVGHFSKEPQTVCRRLCEDSHDCPAQTRVSLFDQMSKGPHQCGRVASTQPFEWSSPSE